MPIKFTKAASTRLFRYVKSVDIKFNRKCWRQQYTRKMCTVFFVMGSKSDIPVPSAFDSRTKSARELWRQMQATRYHDMNPKLKVNTIVSGSADAPEVVFTFVDDSEVRIMRVAYTLIDILHHKSNCYSIMGFLILFLFFRAETI